MSSLRVSLSIVHVKYQRSFESCRNWINERTEREIKRRCLNKEGISF